MVEIKVRNYASTDFNTYMISADKIARIRMLSSVSGIPSFLFVAWIDMVGYQPADTPDYTAIGGRRDRGDPQDIEVLLHYSVTGSSGIKSPLLRGVLVLAGVPAVCSGVRHAPVATGLWCSGPVVDALHCHAQQFSHLLA